MTWSDVASLPQLVALGIVLARTLPLAMVAPLIGPFALGVRVRLTLGLALALVIAPVASAHSQTPPDSIARFLIVAGGEALVGLTLGLGIRILFGAMHAAGEIVAHMSGMQLAEVFSPGTGASVPVFSQLLFLVTTAAFLAIGGHRLTVEALLDTCAWLPPGQSTQAGSLLGAATALLAHSFALGVRIAAPALVALLLAALVMGLLSRALPQLNVMTLGFGINSAVALVALAISLSGACWILETELETALQTLLRALAPT